MQMKNAIYKITDMIPIDINNMLMFISFDELLLLMLVLLLTLIVVDSSALLLLLLEQFCFCWQAVFIITIEFNPIIAPNVSTHPILLKKFKNRTAKTVLARLYNYSKNKYLLIATLYSSRMVSITVSKEKFSVI